MSAYILHNNNWSRKESSVEPKTTGQRLLENMLFIQLKEFLHRSLIKYKGENDLSSKEFGRYHINKWQNITNNWAKWYHEPPNTEHNTTYVEFLPKMINLNLTLRGKTQINPNWEDICRTATLDISKICFILWESKKTRNLSRLKATKKTW